MLISWCLYRKAGILKHMCLFSTESALKVVGYTYIHGVIINAYNILVAYGNGLTVIYFGPTWFFFCYFRSHSCRFSRTSDSQQLINYCQPPPTNVKLLELTNSREVFLIHWYVLSCCVMNQCDEMNQDAWWNEPGCSNIFIYVFLLLRLSSQVQKADLFFWIL